MLGFFELSEEDQPPEHYWLDGEAVSEWFKGVKERRSGGADADGTNESVQNEYTRDM